MEYGKREIYRESRSIGDQLHIPRTVALSLPKFSVYPISIASRFCLELRLQRVHALDLEGRHCGQVLLQLAAQLADQLNLRSQQLKVLWKGGIGCVLLFSSSFGENRCQHKSPFL